MFGKLFEKLGNKGIEILAPVEGEALPISRVSDPTFSEEILGKGIAIRPDKGSVVSPVDGKVQMMFDTGHAVSILSDDGVEVLVHVGLDTVKLKGQFYQALVENGQTVKKGDLLIEFDIKGITGAGYDIITPVVICNSGEYTQFEPFTGKKVAQGETVIRLKK